MSISVRVDWSQPRGRINAMRLYSYSNGEDKVPVLFTRMRWVREDLRGDVAVCLRIACICAWLYRVSMIALQCRRDM